MRGALVIALCATGCFSDRGVVIEVDVGNTGATSVELFIGKEACTHGPGPDGVNCTSITLVNPMRTLMGQKFFRDDPVPSTNKKDQSATFLLKADAATMLPIVIAVGFDQGRRAVGAAKLSQLPIPVDSASIATTTLVMVNDSQDSDRVIVWPTETSPNPCVAVQRGSSTQWDFVVLHDSGCDSLLK